MAKKRGNIISGKKGKDIHYSYRGQQCVRSMPTSVANPQTEPQQGHRNNFGMISKLSSYMKAAHLVGLHWQAVRDGNDTYAIFKHINKDCFTPDGAIDLPHAIVSRGSVERVEITSASIDKGVLTVTFDSHIYGGKATDEFFLIVYFPSYAPAASPPPSPAPPASSPSSSLQNGSCQQT